MKIDNLIKKLEELKEEGYTDIVSVYIRGLESDNIHFLKFESNAKVIGIKCY